MCRNGANRDLSPMNAAVSETRAPVAAQDNELCRTRPNLGGSIVDRRTAGTLVRKGHHEQLRDSVAPSAAHHQNDVSGSDLLCQPGRRRLD